MAAAKRKKLKTFSQITLKYIFSLFSRKKSEAHFYITYIKKTIFFMEFGKISFVFPFEIWDNCNLQHESNTINSLYLLNVIFVKR